MRLKGLIPAGIKVVLNDDLVDHYSQHSLGGGEWSIEAHEGYDDWSPCIKEWVGSNGTREPADDLWKLVDEWKKQVHHKYKLWKAPDGEVGSMSYFMGEARRGHLHGCILALQNHQHYYKMSRITLLSRFIATIPMLIALASIVVFGALAITECLWLGILCALNTLVFATCSHFYEDTVDSVQDFLVRMAEDIIKELKQHVAVRYT